MSNHVSKVFCPWKNDESAAALEADPWELFLTSCTQGLHLLTPESFHERIMGHGVNSSCSIEAWPLPIPAMPQPCLIPRMRPVPWVSQSRQHWDPARELTCPDCASGLLQSANSVCGLTGLSEDPRMITSRQANPHPKQLGDAGTEPSLCPPSFLLI